MVRKQDLLFRAGQALASARKYEVGGTYVEARKNYLFAAEAFGSISRSTDDYAKAAEGLTRVDFVLYAAALKIADTNKAKQLIDEVLQYNPNNKEANEKSAEITKALANPSDISLYGNQAVTPGLVKRVSEIQSLFAEAQQFIRTQQWDQADGPAERIQGIDPYNKAAAALLDQVVDGQKEAYYEKARLEQRQEYMRKVEEKWYEPVNNKDATTIAEEAQPSFVRSTTFDVEQKLKGIFLSLNFSNASIEEATDFLTTESKRPRYGAQGSQFSSPARGHRLSQTITLSLNNLPLEEALRYVCQLANVKYKVESYAISIVPSTFITDDIVTRSFFVQPSFVAPPSAGGVISSISSGFGAGGTGGGEAPTRPCPPRRRMIPMAPSLRPPRIRCVRPSKPKG